MSLRGLAWLLPPGLAMQRAGYGWTVALGGFAMAPVYDFAYRLMANKQLQWSVDSRSKKTFVCSVGDGYVCTSQFFYNQETLWGAYHVLWWSLIRRLRDLPQP